MVMLANMAMENCTIARNYNLLECHVKLLHDLQVLIITIVMHIVINDY